MCLVMLLGGLILLSLVIFVKSALLLLPWTGTAVVLAGLSGVQLGKLAGRSQASRAAVSVASSLVLTVAFGYLGYWLLPPAAPPQKQGLQELLEFPDPTQADLLQMLPIHLAIVGVMGSLVVSRWWYRWSPEINLWPERNSE